MPAPSRPRFSARARGHAAAPPRRGRPAPAGTVAAVEGLRRAVTALATGAPAAVDAAAARAAAAEAAAGADGVAAAFGGAAPPADARVQTICRCAAEVRVLAEVEAGVAGAGEGVEERHVREVVLWNTEAAAAVGERNRRRSVETAAENGAASGGGDGGGAGAEDDFWGSAGDAPAAAAAPAASTEVSPSWLRLRCERLAVTSASGEDGGLTGAELAMTVLSMLQQESRSAEELQGELFDAFGGDFDAVGDVLARRAEIVAQADAVFADCAQAEELRAAGLSGGAAAGDGRRGGPGGARGAASLSTSFMVTDKREVALTKMRRKDERRAVKAGLIPASGAAAGGAAGDMEDDDDSFLPTLGGSAMDELQKAFPGVSLQGDTMIGGRDRVGLPAGATRTVGKGYEEVLIPPPHAPKTAKSRLVSVADALADHPELKPVLKGVETLNRLQSAVYPAAFRSSENLLVCAPTGAGKTNVALLTVMQELVAVKERRQADFKVVYVAPMKALAAEVVEKFGAKLRPLGLRVREFTGDMSLTRRETLETHILVTTPEKWDVVTRKSGSELSDAVTLFIIDEIHLLHDDRGSVLESIVARTLRLSEAAQRVIRLVGLSATLPNYADVAAFMRVNPQKGLFHFDGSHRPVPLSQAFVGVTEGGTSSSMEARRRREAKMLELAWAKVNDALKRGHQAMIFVHSRKATATTGRQIVETAAKEGLQALLLGASLEEAKGEGEEDGDGGAARTLPPWAAKEVAKSRTGDIRELFSKGVGIHHAGLPRVDRKLAERLFGEGVIRVLCCTATLAWGVNLPARAVVILGTDVYDAQKGGFVQLGMLDVMQIFGRAGRPQFDTEGEGTIITKHENLARYLNLLTSSIPIESTLGASASVLADHLNAEIVSGTVASVGDGVTWLSYTYLSVRIAQNPLVYGIGWDEVAADPGLHSRRATLIEQAAIALDDARMCRYDPRTGSLAPTDLGRVSSHFYVSHRTVVLWNELLAKIAEASSGMTEDSWEEMDATVLHAVSCASEFEQMRSRQEELDELDSLAKDACCVRLKATSDSREGKVNVLLQSYISRAMIRMSDLSYVVQSSTRLLRALFEVALRRGLPSLTLSALELARASESRVWPFQHPLWQFCHGPGVRAEYALVPGEVVSRLQDAGPAAELHSLRNMSKEELTELVKSPRNAMSIQRAVSAVPVLEVAAASVAPITRTVLQVKVRLVPSFRWKDSVHGNAESWWLWVEDHEHERIYHSERIMLTKHQVQRMSEAAKGNSSAEDDARRGIAMTLTVPVFDPPSAQYWIRVESERWHTGGGSSACLSLENLALPQREPPHTELLDLRPLDVHHVLQGAGAALYSDSFTHLNPVQTQVFHAAFHSDHNLLIGAPTGSGKTAMAEFAILRAFEKAPTKCVVYIAPLKALARERLADWKGKFSGLLGKRVVELIGDSGGVGPSSLNNADLVVTTPEKWDAVSRGWKRLSFVRSVSVMVLDEVHLLGSDRGPVLEAIVSRARRLSVDPGIGGKQDGTEISSASSVRIVALSTALSNARELGDWIGASPSHGLFNFRPSVRPVPCEVHVIGVAGERYIPRMQSMNRPVYTAIVRYSPTKPVLVFVASRRQTWLTAQDLLRLAAADGKESRFRSSESEAVSALGAALSRASDAALKFTLARGIGIYHAGLAESDRNLVEELFDAGVIQVLVSTSTLAWGVNLPAHLVVVKGTEYFDAEQQRYVDMPVIDLLQMMGRAGRPQFDTQAFAVILVHEPKKTFLKKFLYEPFPVESSLHLELSTHLNAEIASDSIATMQDAMDYLSWTFLFRRMLMNPAYYGVAPFGSGAESSGRKNGSKSVVAPSGIERACSSLVADSLMNLAQSGCVVFEEPIAGAVDSAEAPVKEGRVALSISGGNSAKKAARKIEVLSGDIRVTTTALGRIAASHNLSPAIASRLSSGLQASMSYHDVLTGICRCVNTPLSGRMQEEDPNAKLASSIAKRVVASRYFDSTQEAFAKMGLTSSLGSPEVKARLLVYAYLSHAAVSSPDFVSELKKLLEQCDHLLRSVIDIAMVNGDVPTLESALTLSQLLYQGQMPPADGLQALAGSEIGPKSEAAALSLGILSPLDALGMRPKLQSALSSAGVPSREVDTIVRAVASLPLISMTATASAANTDTRKVTVELKSSGRSTQGFANTKSRIGRRRKEDWVVFVHAMHSDKILAAKQVGSIPKNGCSVSLTLDNAALRSVETGQRLFVVLTSKDYAKYSVNLEINST